MKKPSALRTTVSVLATIIATLVAPALSRAALVAAWGDNTLGQTRLPAGINGVKAIAGGEYHSLALKSDSSVVAWGLNNQGQVNVPPGLANVKAIAAGGNHSLALRVNGTVVAWGSSYYGLTSMPSGLSSVTAIASGAYHNLALKADGTVAAWGDNSLGQTNVPADLVGVVAIAAGANYNLALKADGSVVAWGYNFYGQTNVPADLSNIVAIAAGNDFSLVLRADGTVVSWGQNLDGQTNVPPGLSNVTAIAAGFFHAMALRTDGTLVTWGDNSSGQLAVPPGLSNVTTVAAGGYHSLALAPEGPVQIVQNPQSQGIPFTSNVTFSVTATGFAPLSYQWLFNGSPINPSDIRVSSVTNATLTITNLQFWDIGTYTVIVSNAFGSVLSSGAALIVISPPFITLQPVGQTVRAGTDVYFQASASGTPPLLYQWNFNGTNMPGATNYLLALPNAQPSASGGYSLNVTNAYGFAQTLTASLIVADSAPYIVSQPYYQQPGQRFPTNTAAPIGGGVTIYFSARGSLPLHYQWRFNGVDIPDATNTTLTLAGLRYDQTGYYNVEVSNAFGAAVSAKAFLNVSQVVPWGDAAIGTDNMPVGLSNVIALAAGHAHLTALKADGTVRTWFAAFDGFYSSTTNVPPSATNVIAVAAGQDHSLALRSNGTVVAWGNNSYGQTNVPAGLSNIVAIGAGSYRSFAVRSNGTVVGWGASATVPTGLSNVVAVTVGDYHNLALKQDGTVVAWGSSSATNVPASLSNVVAIAAAPSLGLALRQDGTVAAWGGGSATLLPTGLSNVVALAGGPGYGLALKADGSMAEWGKYYYSMPRGLSNFVAIAAGGLQSPFSAAVVGHGSPAIVLQPSSQIIAKETVVQLHARAVGVQPMSYQWQLENQTLPGATNADLTLTNAQGKDTGGYRMLVSNALGTATSRTAVLAIPYNTNLVAALNTNNWKWSSADGRTASTWFAQNRETHDGDVAAQSGACTNNQQSSLSTTISGPGTLTFWWKVSSEEGFDFLRFYMDNLATPVVGISGETDWQQVSVHLASGNRSLNWIYSKDGSVSAGRDAGWLDEVIFTPDPPTVSIQPPNQFASLGATVSFFAVTSSSTKPVWFQWLKSGTNLVGATNQTLSLNDVGRRDSGNYAVRASNPGGSMTSSNATLKVIVPQRLGSMRFTTDGNLELLARDADGGALLPQDLPAFEAQASTNLVTWETLPNVLSLTNGSLVLRDPGGTNFPARFYRMVEY